MGGVDVLLARNPQLRPAFSGGAPRPIEALPVSISDALVLERLGARSEDDLAGPSVEAIREAKLVSFVLGLHVASLLPTQGGTPLWETPVQVDTSALGRRLGMDVRRVETAVQRLVKAGVFSRQSAGAVCISEAVCAPRTPSDEVPWADVLERLGGQLSAIVVCRAIARHKERVDHPIFEWTPVSDAALEKLTGYSGSTIRRVRVRLREAAVLQEERVDGAPSVYRFMRAVATSGSRVVAQVEAPASSPTAPAVTAPVPVSPVAGVAQCYVVPEGVVVEAFGSPLAVPAGFTIELGEGVGAMRVERDAEGRDVLHIGPLRIRRL